MTMGKKNTSKKELKFEEKKQIKGGLGFRSLDKHVARFEMDVKGKPVDGQKRIDFDASILPDDFDLDKYEVSATYSFSITVKEK